MSDLAKRVAYYTSRLSGSQGESAWHSLVELGADALPDALDAFRPEQDVDVKRLLVEVVDEYRSVNAVEFLADLVSARESHLWTAALDGLVRIGGTQASAVLAAARETAPHERREWIDEALVQMEAPT